MQDQDGQNININIGIKRSGELENHSKRTIDSLLTQRFDWGNQGS